MFWIWFLCLLGIVNAQMTTQGSTALPVGVTTQASSAPPAPVTQAPVTAPETQAPVTQAPVIQAPITQAPVTQAPTTPTPTQVPTTISTSTTLESISSIYSRKSRKRFVLLQNSYEQLIADLNKKLQAILIAYEPESLGNAELGLWLRRINNIITFGEEEYSAKVETYIDFIRYNDERLRLEDLITDRINKINDLLPNIEPYTICNRFYLNQRKKLKDAFRLSNAEKQTLLKENSSGCPYDNDEYYDDYDYYFYLDYFETK